MEKEGEKGKAKEEEEHEPDYSSLNKYFKEDNELNRTVKPKQKIITEDVSINETTTLFHSAEEEIETSVRNKKVKIETENDEGDTSKELIQAKKEFFQSLDDEDSLDLNTCANINRNWEKS